MIKNILNNRKFKLIFSILIPLLTVIITLLIIIFPVNKNNSQKTPYLFYLDYKNNVEKYNNHYEIYQLNTTNIFKYDRTRFDNKIFEDS